MISAILKASTAGQMTQESQISVEKADSIYRLIYYLDHFCLPLNDEIADTWLNNVETCS